MIELILAVSLVLIVSTLCSLFEAVLYSVPITYVETQAETGRLSGKLLRKFRRNVDKPIAAILSLNTISHTVGAAVAGAAVAAVFGNEYLGIFSAIFTVAILVISEVIPKTIGVLHNRRLAPRIAIPLQVLIWLMMPLVWLCRATTFLISGRREKREPVSDQELIVMARLGLKAGTIDRDEAEVIKNILELEKKKASDIMTPRSVVAAVEHETTVAQTVQNENFYTYARLPVYDEDLDQIVGVVQRPRVLKLLVDGKGDTPVDQVMRPVRFVAESTPVDHLLHLFLTYREHLMIVLDAEGLTAGVVTLEDVLEEIIGREIVDESDVHADLRDLARRRRKIILEGK